MSRESEKFTGIFVPKKNTDTIWPKFFTEISVQMVSAPLGGDGGVLGLIFAGYVPLASQSPYPITVYSVPKDWLHLSHF